jgi:hypothetical protein
VRSRVAGRRNASLEPLGRILDRGGDADDVLRATVAVLAAEPGICWAGVFFRERDGLVLGPHAGEPDEQRRTRTLITYRGDPVGELAVDGETTKAFLDRVAALISDYALLGWDTGGKAWEP